MAELTSFKLQLGLLSKLALGERVAVSGCSALQHSAPVDRSKYRHQHPQQGTCNETGLGPNPQNELMFSHPN